MSSPGRPELPQPAFDVRIFFAGLLASTSAEQRARGLHEWSEHGGSEADLVPLLDDDAPLVRERAGRAYLVEVRAPTLVALQDRCRSQRNPWPFGAVRVRRAMPVEEAEAEASALLAALGPDARADAESDADRVLRERVNPPPEHRSACRAYLVLRQAGRIGHELQDVDPASLLTPLQQEILDGQMISPRPRPHVRFDGPAGRPVGYLYLALGRTVLDLDESQHAGLIRDHLAAGVRRGSLPPWDCATARSLEHLRDVAAYVSGPFHAQLVQMAGLAVRIESYERSRVDDESGELTFWVAGRRLVAETRLYYETDWNALTPGRVLDVELRLQRWFDEDGQGFRPAGPALERSGRLVAEDGVLYRVDGPLAGLLRHEHDGRREVVLHVDVGLGAPVQVDGIAPDEVDGLAVGDRIALRAVLQAWPSS